MNNNIRKRGYQERGDELVSLLKKNIDGVIADEDSLVDLPNAEMRLYGVYGFYFVTLEKLVNFCQNNDISIDNVYVLDYIRNIAGRSDVIRKIDKDGRSVFYTAIDRDGYGVYNDEKSRRCGEFVWEFNYGSIEELYAPFREIGVVFEIDIYAKLNEEMKHVLKFCREKNLFNVRSCDR